MKVLSVSSLAFLAIGTVLAADNQINVYRDVNYKGTSAVVSFNNNVCATWPTLQNQVSSFFIAGTKNGACVLYGTSNCSDGGLTIFSLGPNGYYLDPDVGSSLDNKINAIRCYPPNS